MANEIGSRGSVILVEYPYTDLSGSKVRPAVIVTADKYIPHSDDVLCAFISSALPDPMLPSDIVLSSSSAEFAATGLRRTSILRPHKLMLLSKRLAVEKLGDLPPSIVKKMDESLKDALGL